MRYLLAIFLCMPYLSFTQIEMDTVYVGPTRNYQNLSEALEYWKVNTHIFVDEGVYTEDQEVEIWKSNNLIIEGLGHVELHCSALHKNVMWIISSDNIVIRNLHLKHFKPGNVRYQNCTGRVIALDNADQILIEDCDINGCGLIGVHDNLGNGKVHLKNNYIHFNSLAPFGDIDGNTWMHEVDDHPVFTFENNRVENNGPDRVLEGDTLTYYDLDSTTRAEIDRWDEEWHSNGMGTCVPILEIEMNCKDCESVALDVLLYVGEDGEVTKVEVLRDYIRCGDEERHKEIRACLIEALNNSGFGEELSNRIFRFRAGWTLKC